MRTPDELRTEIARSREEIVTGLLALRTRVDAATDWRRWYARRPGAWLVGALFVGFALGGGLTRPRHAHRQTRRRIT